MDKLKKINIIWYNTLVGGGVSPLIHLSLLTWMCTLKIAYVQEVHYGKTYSDCERRTQKP